MYLQAILFLATGAAASLAGQSQNAPVNPFGSLRKRQLASCESTYGNGSLNCGDSTFCFNPSIGQVRSSPPWSLSLLRI